MVKVENLSFRYGTTLILDDISLHARAGEVLCLLGPNGCGKTTLMDCLLGILSPQAGRVILQGRDVAGLNPAEIAKRTAYIPPDPREALSFLCF